MNQKIIFAILFFSSATICNSQIQPLVREEWDPHPALHAVNSKLNTGSALIILQRIRFEYRDEVNKEVGLYFTQHSIVRVNDEKGIQSYNKIYLGATNSMEIVDVKARTISPSGKVIEVDKSNIKDIKEEDGNLYKIFAMDGLEKGSEVEYYYTFRRGTSFFGRTNIQGAIPVHHWEFQIIAPPRLTFELRQFHTGLSITDTVLNDKRIVSCSLQDIPEVEEEKYASYRSNLQRVEFKLSYNEARKGERLFTWNELAKRTYEQYTGWKDRELNKVGDMVKQNGWDQLSGDESKIIAIENYIKKNFTTREDIEGENASNLEAVIKNKIASFLGIVRLYGAIFRQLNINTQIVFVCDRGDYTIDKNFENWNNCDLPVFYFAAFQKYMAPSRSDFRYPYIYPAWGDANGLFCKSTTIGNFTTAIAEIKPVQLENYSGSYDNIDARMELNKGLDTVLVNTKYMYGGYPAQFMRAAYNFRSAEDQRTMIKEMIKTRAGTDNIVASAVENPEFENASMNKPFVLTATVKVGELLETAGNKILVKIGEMIGKQVEMYQEKPRQLPVNMDFPNFQERTIRFTIPAGYKIRNPEVLKTENVFRENGDITMEFTSDYKMDGDILSVHIMEQYRKSTYPVSQFEEFKKIVNASADFNKVVLVLEKK